MDNASPVPSPGSLHGWKEIAAYFDRSVRSVQRWELTLGLPIRRISTPEGRQIVYADRNELDGWLRRMDTKRLADDVATSEPAYLPDSSTEPTVAGSELTVGVAADGPASKEQPESRRLRVVSISLALVFLMVLGVYAGTRLTWVVPEPEPAKFEFAGTEVQALARDGRLAWTYDLGEISSFPMSGTAAGTAADLDDDGQLEFIIPVRKDPPGTARPGETDEVVALSNQGHLLWSVRPETVLSLAGRQFHGPWHFRAIAVSTGPGQRRVWIAYSHHTWSPGLVFEVAPNGTQSLRYVQMGWITALAYWRAPTGGFVAIGGVNNEYERPALALLSEDGTAAQSPQDSGARFDCIGCPTGNPAAYFIFPASEVARAEGHPYAFVEDLYGEGDQLLATFTDPRMGFVDPASLTARIEMIDAYWAEHRILETASRIGHSADVCPERNLTGVIRRWMPDEGWGNQTPSPTSGSSQMRRR